MGAVVNLAAGDVLTRRLAMRFQFHQSALLIRVDGAAAALEQMGLPDIANGLRHVAEQAETASQNLLARVEQT